MPAAMPGSVHETLLEILTLYPEWLNAWLSLVRPDVDGHWTVADSTVRVVRPSEVRPDLVLVDLVGRRWVALEVQLEKDDAKAQSWSLIAAALWNEHKFPGDIVVITASRSVAEWSRRVCNMRGALGTRALVRPVVLNLSPAAISQLVLTGRPEVAFLAVWMMQGRHGPKARDAVVKAMGVASRTQEPLRSLLMESIIGVMSPVLLACMKEETMKVDRLSPEGREFLNMLNAMSAAAEARGAASGQAKGEALGEALGEARGRAAMLLTLLRRRGVPVDEATEARVKACTDLATLDRWFDNAVTANRPEDVFSSNGGSSS